MLIRQRKQEQKVVVNCNEIDYEKLSSAIVKAQIEYNSLKNSEEERVNDAVEEKIGFWKAVKIIILNERPGNGTMVSGILASIISLVFNIMALLLAVLSIVFLVAGIGFIMGNIRMNSLDCFTAISLSILIVVLIVISFLIALLFRASANEIKAENDRNYIVSMFSGLVSFVALIIALVALLNDNTGEIVTILGEIKAVISN